MAGKGADCAEEAVLIKVEAMGSRCFAYDNIVKRCGPIITLAFLSMGHVATSSSLRARHMRSSLIEEQKHSVRVTGK